VGRILRKTMIDEFPQFWNVLLGNMSLVGTRPPTLDEVRHYEHHHWRRLKVKPGITGLWQASKNRHTKGFEDVLALDLEYQKRWNVSLDLLIIIKTIYGALVRTQPM
jgi:lipopolysaccharide/colanic/teichoic acid biosynthesis glycosyltransferase